ncbi:penicillin-binding protein 1A [Methylohalomonas lacus]|uniref:Penicillin-binding protein 1A n=1 Tax=Methylohalomonas lacus TaxID=398773 RepID=A0AAE3HNT9_9GAMM|nr:penicillin-binding protein 1A [Methylohalomonas lacus]MCS3904142.1 penicillin-binding protein 1A [Methylohalomonas lacus]
MLRFAFNALLGLILLGAAGAAIVALYIVPQLPEIEQLRDVELQVPLRVYSHDSSLIAEFGEMRRSPVDVEDIPPRFIQAFLAAEDDRFFEHPGVDWQGILRAAIELVRTGEKTQGGSTITMQVARNFFLSREKSYLRKINEIFLALKMERELSKQEILELYLNKIYLGQRAYGIAAAARVYYGSDVNELTLDQMALIAGLPKAPSTTNPVTSPERARDRRTYVLNRMKQLGYIDAHEYGEAVNMPVAVQLHGTRTELNAPYVAEMVRKYMIETYGEEETYTGGYRVYTTLRDEQQTAANQALRQALLDYDRRHGYRGPEHNHELPADGDADDWRALLDNYSTLGGLKPALVTDVGEKSLSVYVKDVGAVDIGWDGMAWAQPYKTENWRGAKPETAADVASAGDIVRVVAAQAASSEESTTAESDTSEPPEQQWRLSQLPAVEGALVSLDPSDGATLALTGGFDFERSKFNRVTQARRQPGSSFKPFIYSAALAKGYTPASLINDAPIMFADTSIDDEWRPKNYSGKSYGPTRMREALIHSRNLVSIRLLHAVGLPFALEHMRRFGFDTEKLPANLSLALGSGGVTPYELARGYSVFANGGFLVQPYFIDHIERYDEGEVYAAEPLLACNECETDNVTERTEEVEDAAAGADDPAAVLQAGAGLTPLPPALDRFAPRTLDAQNAWLISSMTRDVVRRGTGARAYRELGRDDLSGKTGTTNDQRDAWFAGFNRDIVTVVWVGFDQFQPLGNRETGASAALPMWIDHMRVVLEGHDEAILPRPDGLVNARIDPDTGKLARADNPDAVFEIFPADNVPSEYSRSQRSDSYRGGDGDGEYSDQLF